jgi:hypothetical protein
MSKESLIQGLNEDLAGEPTTTPSGFDKPDSLKAMLEVDLAMEQGPSL